MSDRYTTADLFGELDGLHFHTNYEFETAVLSLFNSHLRDFPPGYGYRDAIEQADQRGWLQVKDGKLFVQARTPA